MNRRSCQSQFTNHPTSPRLGFTMIETLVSIGILGLLAAMILPAVQNVRESARRSECRNNLKQIILACHEHQESHQNYGMPSVGLEVWSVRILPYLEQQKPLIQNDGQVIGGPETIAVYRCPSDPFGTGAVTLISGMNYYPNDGHGLFKTDGFYRKRTGGLIQPSDITDGLSNTAALSERRAMLNSIVVGTDFTDESTWHHRIVRKTSTFPLVWDI